MRTKLIIFGITGDLSRRKLLPALEKIVSTGEFEQLHVVGVSRSPLDVSSLVGPLLSMRTSGFRLNMADGADYKKLYEHLAISDGDQAIIYLAVPPLAVNAIVKFLYKAGFSRPNVKLLFEKPFGVDETSARETIELTTNYFEEDQLYRIDHYLAKEMAQNIVMFRSANAMLARLWGAHAIESIEVIATETIGIESRGEFYEQTGALCDVVQGHLMQLLALVLMDIPPNWRWSNMPDLRLEALEQLVPASPERTIRAQYKGYRADAHNDASEVETFVRTTLTSRDPRWRGVPLTLVTGKSLSKKTTEIRVNFRKVHDAQSNSLVFHIQPDEGVEIDLFIKKPGYSREQTTRSLAFNYPDDELLPDAYEQVLVDAIKSESSLFASSGEILASWHILQSLLDAWSMETISIPVYPVGTDWRDV